MPKNIILGKGMDINRWGLQQFGMCLCPCVLVGCCALLCTFREAFILKDTGQCTRLRKLEKPFYIV